MANATFSYPPVCAVPVSGGPAKVISLQITAEMNAGNVIPLVQQLERKRLIVCNNSAANPLTFNCGVRAVVSQQGITLPPLLPAAGAGHNFYDSGAGYCPVDDIYINGTVGQWFTIMEWR